MTFINEIIVRCYSNIWQCFVVGCVHAAELAFLFGYSLMDVEGNEAVKNNTGVVTLVNYDDKDVAYAEFMITLWTNFAKFGYVMLKPLSINQSKCFIST